MNADFFSVAKLIDDVRNKWKLPLIGGFRFMISSTSGTSKPRASIANRSHSLLIIAETSTLYCWNSVKRSVQSKSIWVKVYVRLTWCFRFDDANSLKSVSSEIHRNHSRKIIEASSTLNEMLATLSGGEQKWY